MVKKFNLNILKYALFMIDDEEQSIESRKRVLKYAKENKLFIAGHHLQFSNSAMYKKFYENK